MIKKLLFLFFFGLSFCTATPNLALESDMASKALQLVSNHKGKLALAGTLLASYQLYKKYQNELKPYINQINSKNIIREIKLNTVGVIALFLVLKKYILLFVIWDKLEKNTLIKNEKIQFLIANFLSSLSTTLLYKLLKFYRPREFGLANTDIIDQYQTYNDNLPLKALIDSATLGFANHAVIQRRMMELDFKIHEIIQTDDIETLKYYDRFLPVNANNLKDAIDYRAWKSLKYIIEQLGSIKDIKIPNLDREVTLLEYAQIYFKTNFLVFLLEYDEIEVDQNLIIANHYIINLNNHVQSYSAPAINHALYYCNVKAVQNCIKQGGILYPNHVFPFNQRPAIIHAVLNNKPEMVKFLLENNADTTIVDSEGKTMYDYLNEIPEQQAQTIKNILKEYRLRVTNEVQDRPELIPNLANIVSAYVV